MYIFIWTKKKSQKKRRKKSTKRVIKEKEKTTPEANRPDCLNSPHDQFFTYAFSDKENLRDLLNQYIPASVLSNIDLPSLSVTKESYIDEDLRKNHSDLLVTATLKENKGSSAVLIYILLEHKGYPDKWTVFQLLKYMVRIWDKQQVLVRLLKRKFSLSPEEEQEILAVHDPDLLDNALDEIITAENKEEVLGLMQ